MANEVTKRMLNNVNALRNEKLEREQAVANKTSFISRYTTSYAAAVLTGFIIIGILYVLDNYTNIPF